MFHTEAIKLEELLAGRGMAVRVGKASLGTDAIRFPLQLGLGTTTRRLMMLSQDVAREAGYSRCKLRRQGHTLFLELPRSEGAGLRYGDLLDMAGTVPADSTLVGQRENGTAVALDITAPTTPHLLITGSSSTSTSDFLRVLALGMACHHSARHWRMALLTNDPRSALAPFQSLPHTWAYSTQSELSLGWLVRLIHEMNERERAQVTTPNVLVLIEHADTLFKVGGRVAQGLVASLVKRGAAVGLHVILAAETISDDMAGLFPAKLYGVEGVQGRFLYAQGDELAPMRTARLEENEVRQVLTRLQAQRVYVVAHPPAKD